jgi:hypothetical protein
VSRDVSGADGFYNTTFNCRPTAYIDKTPYTYVIDLKNPKFPCDLDPESEKYNNGYDYLTERYVPVFYRRGSHNVTVHLYDKHGNTNEPPVYVGGDLSYSVPGNRFYFYIPEQYPCAGSENLYPSPIVIPITDDNRNYCLPGAPIILKVYYDKTDDQFYLWNNGFQIPVLLDSAGYRIHSKVQRLNIGTDTDEQGSYMIFAISEFEDETPDPLSLSYNEPDFTDYNVISGGGTGATHTIPSVNFMGGNSIP